MRDATVVGNLGIVVKGTGDEVHEYFNQYTF